MRDTTRLRKMCERHGVLSKPSRRSQRNRYFLQAKTARKNLRMRKNLAKWLPHRICKESVAFALFTTCDLSIGDLAIESLGVHAIESLDVRVATNFVKMMKRKKVARNRFSNVDSSIVILVAALHRMVLASFSRSSE